MISTRQRHLYTYDVGEDVVVRLEGIDVYDLERMAPVPRSCLPAWTIARVSRLLEELPRPAYLIQGRVWHHRCIWVADESAIDGALRGRTSPPRPASRPADADCRASTWFQPASRA